LILSVEKRSEHMGFFYSQVSCGFLGGKVGLSVLVEGPQASFLWVAGGLGNVVTSDFYLFIGENSYLQRMEHGSQTGRKGLSTLLGLVPGIRKSQAVLVSYHLRRIGFSSQGAENTDPSQVGWRGFIYLFFLDEPHEICTP
jgi:hypothetical protein